MKNVFLILVFSLNIQIYAQEEDVLPEYLKNETLILQKKAFKQGEKLLKKSEVIKAIHKYHFVYRCNLNTEYEKIAKNKIDSLLPIIQRHQIKKAKGKWKLKLLTNELLFYYPKYEYIEITDHEIIFFEQNLDTLPSRIESIVLSPYENNDMELSTSSLSFENGEIWEFLTGKKKKEKKLYPSIKRNADGSRTRIINEIGIIINSKDRKKEYTQERSTYYILEKKN